VKGLMINYISDSNAKVAFQLRLLQGVISHYSITLAKWLASKQIVLNLEIFKILQLKNTQTLFVYS